MLAQKNEISHYLPEGVTDPLKIAQGALDLMNEGSHDLLIMDTAGRLHIDTDMMVELTDVQRILKPEHVIFVADAMTGQDAVNAV